MNKIAFYGSIYSEDYQAISALLKDWIGTDTLDIKIRLGGEEIVYETEELYLYCHNTTSSKESEPRFLLEGNMSGTLDEAKICLQGLLQKCRDKHINGHFEYVEVNEDGDEVSDQFFVQ